MKILTTELSIYKCCYLSSNLQFRQGESIMQSTPIKLHDVPVIGYSNMSDTDVFALERQFGAHHYDRLNVVVRKAEGSWITDINGQKYLDCLAAYSAANLGHHHPKDTCVCRWNPSLPFPIRPLSAVVSLPKCSSFSRHTNAHR